jgi:hypothetical protein
VRCAVPAGVGLAILERQPKDALAGDYRRLKMLLEQ